MDSSNKRLLITLASVIAALSSTACSDDGGPGAELGDTGESSSSSSDTGTTKGTETNGTETGETETETGETETETETETGEDFDCDNLPEPVIRQLTGAIAAADVAFDDQGNLVGSDTQALFKAAAGDQAKVWVPGMPGRAGVRYLSDGRLAFVQEELSRVMLIDPDGNSQILASNLDFPFGAAVDLADRVYIADYETVVRADPSTGDTEDWLTNVPGGARWLSFDLDYDGLFVGAMSSTIYRAPIDANGDAGTPVAFGTLPIEDAGGTDGGADWGEEPGGFVLVDGIGVDACGNVYVAEYSTDALYRIPATGGEGELLIDWDSVDYGHGIEWGSGLGGWSDHSLFLPQPYNNHTVVEVEIGVPSKPRPFP